MVIGNTLFQERERQRYTWTSPDGNTEIRLIISFSVKDKEILYSQQRQYLELTVSHIKSYLLQNSDFTEESRENH